MACKKYEKVCFDNGATALVYVDDQSGRQSKLVNKMQSTTRITSRTLSGTRASTIKRCPCQNSAALLSKLFRTRMRFWRNTRTNWMPKSLSCSCCKKRKEAISRWETIQTTSTTKRHLTQVSSLKECAEAVNYSPICLWLYKMQSILFSTLNWILSWQTITKP